MKRFSAHVIIGRYFWTSTQKLGLKSRLSISSRIYKVIQFGQIFFRVLGRDQLISRFLKIQFMCALIEINRASLQCKMTLVFNTIILNWLLRVPSLLSLNFCLLEVKHWHSRLPYTFWHYRFLFIILHASKIHIHIYSIRLNTVLLLNIPRISNFIGFDLNCFVSLVIREERLFYFNVGFSFFAYLGLEVLECGRTRW